ncbi:hypothetical protein EGX94_07490 [Propionibacterium acidifaciens]|nr:hypothetical protein [Propionibacterium acidifaciens]AYW77930.1 hypothetical protein EGX94_07490 [Propionibacterium acidifaciens]
MALAESRVTTRRSLPVGIFSVVVAIVLITIAVIWFRFGTPTTSIIWIVLAVLEIVIAVLMLRPITFHVTVDEDGVRNEGHAPWSIDRASIANGGVIAAKHPTIWVRPVPDAALKRSLGYTESTIVPERSYLAPVRRSQAESLARALASIGLQAGRKAVPEEINKIGAFRVGSTAMGMTGVAAAAAGPARASAEPDEAPAHAIGAAGAKTAPGRAPDPAPAAPVASAERTAIIPAGRTAAVPAARYADVPDAATPDQGPPAAPGPDPHAPSGRSPRAASEQDDVIEATEPIGWPGPSRSGPPDGVSGPPAGSEPIGWPVGARRATPEEDAAWLYGDKAASTVVTTETRAPQRARREGRAAVRRPGAGRDESYHPRRARRAVLGAVEDLEDERPTRPMRAITDDMTREEAFGAEPEPSS